MKMKKDFLSKMCFAEKVENTGTSIGYKKEQSTSTTDRTA
jgi:hypothetical protein